MLRSSIRSLRAQPGFAAAAVVILAVGIAASTITFTVVLGVLLRPLPFPESSRIIRIWSSLPERNLPFFSVSASDAADWRERAGTLEQLAVYERETPATLADAGIEPVFVARVERRLFDLLGVPPFRGRVFTRQEDAAGADARVAVISHDLWQSRLGGRADIIGHLLSIGAERRTVVGVMPAGFHIPNNAATIWTPLNLVVDPARRSNRYLRVLGRLREHGQLDAARTELEGIASALAAEHPVSNRSWSVSVRPLLDTVVNQNFRHTVWMLSGAVAFLLLIACTNVAGLLLSRATARRKEMAIRTALGASRAALVRQLVVESLLLAAIAGAVGVTLAMWGIDGLARLAAGMIPRVDEIAMRWPVILFATVMTLGTTLLFGLMPALHVSRDLQGNLRTREITADRNASRWRDGLVVIQVSLAIVLLIGAGLMVRTLVALQQRELGFSPRSLLVAQVTTKGETEPGRRRAAVEEWVAAASRLPGVRAAAAGSSLPFAGPNSATGVDIEGWPTGSESPDADYRVVTPGYFATLQIPVMRGRTFTAHDDGRVMVAIISAAAARRFYGDANPVGRRLRFGGSDWLTVVGVTADVRYREVEESGTLRPMIYVPHAQMPGAPMTLAIRADDRSMTLSRAVRDAIAPRAGIDAVLRIDSMEDLLGRARGPQRFAALVMSVFAWVAQILAIAGLWSVVAYGVARRTQEIGIRVAMGARPAQVVRMTAGRGFALAALGIVGGLIASLPAARALETVLFSVDALDPVTYIAVALLFATVATAASVLPAWRALRIDPVVALRTD